MANTPGLPGYYDAVMQALSYAGLIRLTKRWEALFWIPYLQVKALNKCRLMVHFRTLFLLERSKNAVKNCKSKKISGFSVKRRLFLAGDPSWLTSSSFGIPGILRVYPGYIWHYGIANAKLSPCLQGSANSPKPRLIPVYSRESQDSKNAIKKEVYRAVYAG